MQVIQQLIQFIKQLWLTVRSNKYFVAFEGGASGVIFSTVQDELQQGHLDFSHAGLTKLGMATALGGVTAVRLLIRPAPGAVPVNK
jgi:hypothetical protein